MNLFLAPQVNKPVIPSLYRHSSWLSTELGNSRVGGGMENGTLSRCFTLRNALMAMPVSDPARKEAWFVEVGKELATITDAIDLRDWMQFFAEALEEKHGGVNRDLCYYLIEERVRNAKGGVMQSVNYRRNERLVPVAVGGTADEFLSSRTSQQMGAIDAQAEADYRTYNFRVFATALIVGTSILGFAFWPSILGWMTEFKYGVLAGALGMAAFLIGGLAVGVCLGAGRLEKRS